MAALLAGVPVVVHTYHGHVLRGYFSPAKTAVYRAIERGLAHRTDRLLTVTPRVREELLALGVGRPAQYRSCRSASTWRRCSWPNGGAASCAPSSVGEAPLVGIVARLVPIKAHEVFLATAARVRAARARRAVPDRRRRRTAAPRSSGRSRQLGLAGAVRFLGWRADLDRLYADLDVVALTSRNEGSPVALIEAMAAGVAVVSTDVGGVADVVEHGVTRTAGADGRRRRHGRAHRDAARRSGAASGDGPARPRPRGRHLRRRPAGADVQQVYEELLTEKRISP